MYSIIHSIEPSRIGICWDFETSPECSIRVVFSPWEIHYDWGTDGSRTP